MFNFLFKVPTWSPVWTNLVVFLHKRGFTVKKQDGCKTGSASASSVKPETKTVLTGQTSVSTPLRSTPGLENAQSPSSQSPSGGPEPARGATEVQGDDVFSPADEVFLAPDVLTLSKKTADVKAPQAVQAPGTIHDVLLKLWPSAPLLPCSALACLTQTTSLRSLWEFPLLFPRVWSLLVLVVQAPSLPTFHFWKLCLYFFTFVLCLLCQRHQLSGSSAVWLDGAEEKCLQSLKKNPTTTNQKLCSASFLCLDFYLLASRFPSNWYIMGFEGCFLKQI